MQICIIGFNPILTEKLLNEYSYSKNMIFYCLLFIFSFAYGVFFIYQFSSEFYNTFKILDLCKISIVPFIAFSIFTFICSVCYFTENNLKRARWNNIFMAEFIFFKILDFQILSFFNFLDNSDIFNTTLVITFEKLLWKIIETIIDIVVKNIRTLILIQIIITSIIIVVSIIGFIKFFNKIFN